MSHPPPAEPDPTAPMPAYTPDPAAPPYRPGQAPVPSYPPGYAAVPEPPSPETGYVAGAPYPPPYGQAVAAPSKGRPLLVGGIIVATLLFLCCAGGVVAYVAYRTIPAAGPTSGPGSAPSNPARPSTGAPTSEPTAAQTDPSEPGETFNMAVGDAVIITEGDNEWRVTITDMRWRNTSCGGLAAPDGRLLIADVTFEVVQGRASINPLYFTWVDSGGGEEDTFSALFTGCAEPSLDSGNNLRAGARRSGRIAFDVTGSTTGTIVYEELFGGPQASWVAPPP